jgi:hypothetical protein
MRRRTSSKSSRNLEVHVHSAMIPALGLSSCSIPCSSAPKDPDPEAEAPMGVEALASIGREVEPVVAGAEGEAEVTSRWAPSS